LLAIKRSHLLGLQNDRVGSAETASKRPTEAFIRIKLSRCHSYKPTALQAFR
jgi:hypothetical protein